MLFEQIRHGGCLSYLIGCDDTRTAIVVDPELDEIDRYLALAAEKGVRIRFLLDTHTHADHFTGTRELARQLGVPVVMHRRSAAPFVDLRVEDGETLLVGKLRFRVIETPGHTDDSMSLRLVDRVLTGDALLIGGTGRTDLPTGDPEALYDSLFGKLLRLPDETLMFPAHDYKQRTHSTIGAERAANPRLQAKERGAFVELMRGLDLAMPQHLTEALRTNRSGGKTVKQLIAEAAHEIAFMSMDEVQGVDRGGRAAVVAARRARARGVPRRPPARRAQHPARRAGAARRPRAARPDRAHRQLLPVRQGVDAGGAHAAHDGLPARGRAGRRPGRLGVGRVPAGRRAGARVVDLGATCARG